ncbi:MerR family transcriptional regulator [Enterovirga aerilata]|uniref:MerR family transcriptional regulator n=1 Tax=Enterovirga aerilata TaxID=2730920 RepID=A0A849I842_9HYPH|nr:MerR family transcriptional regulator [Enterovirga sp. DB1703]NNM73491.1 MerR family transcriptional regulator [Enterovirga sp. DB1703]
MQKSPDAFRTISEVAADLDIPQHVLRFWETRFSPIRPLKRGGGRRYYRPDDVDLLKGIRHLLYGQGYTIKGVQRILKEDGLRFVQAIGRGEQVVAVARPDSQPDDGPELGDFEAAELKSDPGRPQAVAREAADPEEPAHPRLAAEDVAALQAALDELLECERILGTLRRD